MKTYMKDGTIIECTTQEYIELKKAGLLTTMAPKETPRETKTEDKAPVRITPAIRKDEAAAGAIREKTHHPKRKTKIHNRKWTDEEKTFIKEHRKEPMVSIARKMNDKYTPGAIMAQLYGMAKTGQFPRNEIGSSGKFFNKDNNKRWSSEDDARLISLMGEHRSYVKVHKYMPERTYKSIKERYYKLVNTGQAPSEYLPQGRMNTKEPVKNTKRELTKKTTNHPPKHIEYLRKRMKFMTSRAKELCKMDKTLSYEKAMKRASQEWGGYAGTIRQGEIQ